MAEFMRKKAYRVAVMGATGAVGREMVSILEERKFPVSEVLFLASSRSAGQTISFRGKKVTVRELTEHSFEGADIVLASAGGSISRKFAPAAVHAGAVVIDNTSAFRMDPKVPLVIPEINEKDIFKHSGIIANPNCSTIVLLVAIYPLHRVNPIRRMTVATYQAASGAGAQAMEELKTQTEEVLAGKTARPKIFPHPIAFNLFSHNSSVGPDGYNEEEIKMVKETYKILGTSSIRILPTCVRVPVFRAHTEAIFIEFARPMKVRDARKILAKAPGVKIVDDPARNHFPMPIEAAHGDDILVGRLRQDLASDKGLGLLVSGDQIRKGAALNAVQIAEKLCGLRSPAKRAA